MEYSFVCWAPVFWVGLAGLNLKWHWDQSRGSVPESNGRSVLLTGNGGLDFPQTFLKKHTTFLLTFHWTLENWGLAGNTRGVARVRKALLGKEALWHWVAYTTDPHCKWVWLNYNLHFSSLSSCHKWGDIKDWWYWFCFDFWQIWLIEKKTAFL